MRKTILISFAAFVVLLISSLSAFPQEFPKHEFFGGFSYAGMEERDWFGWKISGVRNFNRYFGIAIDISGLDSTKTEEIFWLKHKSDNRRYYFLAGPKFTRRDHGRWMLYFHFLMGASMTSSSYDVLTWDDQVLGSGSRKVNAFALTLGVGIDYRLKGPLAIRLV